MVKGINMVLCEVEDIDRAIGFYRDVLKLSAEMTSPHWSSFRLGSGRIGLHPPFGGARNGPAGWILCVEVEDVRAFRRDLEEAGHMAGAYHDTPSGVVMDFVDPDGNRLQAIQLGVKASSL